MESGLFKTTFLQSISTSPPTTTYTPSSSLKISKDRSSFALYSNSSSGMIRSTGGRVESTSKMPSKSSFVPSPEIAVIGKILYFLPNFFLTSFKFSSAPKTSHLLHTITCGTLASTSLYSLSSALIFLKSSMGSRPSHPETSNTWQSIRVLSICRRKSCPSPAPFAAPSISPGISAATNDFS